MSGSARPPPAGWRACRCSAATGSRPGRCCSRWRTARQRAAVAEAEAQLARARAQLADLKLGKRPEEIARIEANLAEAKAALAYAEQDLDRQAQARPPRFRRRGAPRSGPLRRPMRAGPAVAAMEADLATARLPARDDQIAAAAAEVAMREASLAQARWELEQRTVRAPMAALVEDRVRDSGRVGRCRRHRRQPAAAGQRQGALLRARAGAGRRPRRPAGRPALRRLRRRA